MTIKLQIFSISWCNLSKSVKHTHLYCSNQLESSFRQFCEKPLHITFKPLAKTVVLNIIGAGCLWCRGENILLFLVQTVGRQLVEQRQYRPSRVRSSGGTARKHVNTAELGWLIVGGVHV